MDGLMEKLQRAGLTGNESKIYLELLKLGEANGNILAHKTGIDRSLTYTVLNNLKEKGLVSYIIKDKKRVFRPTSPEHLLNPVRDKELLIKALIPELTAIKPRETPKSHVTVYEGKEGLKVLFEEGFKKTKSKRKEWLFFGGTGRSYEVLKWEMPHIIKRTLKAGISVRGIISYDYRKHEVMDLPYSDIRTVKGVNSHATTTIVADSIGIHILTDKPLIIIIKNKEIADGYRAYFEYMWKHSQKI